MKEWLAMTSDLERKEAEGAKKRGIGRRRKQLVLALIVAVLIVLNFFTFISAIPETNATDGGCCTNHPLARDFSAYYVAAWRLFHDPSNIYTSGVVNDGGVHVAPQPEPFKYLPSMLIFISPLLVLDYHAALLAFDVAQLLLLIPIAILITKLLQGHSIVVTGAVLAVALLNPSPLSFPSSGFSITYFWQWGEGQSKVLLLFLLLLSLYFAKKGRPILSGILLGVASFDPRFALLSLPLFVAYSQSTKRLAYTLETSILTSAALNLPILLLSSTTADFLKMLFFAGWISTPVYPYAFIPALTLAAISIVERRPIVAAVSNLARREISLTN